MLCGIKYKQPVAGEAEANAHPNNQGGCFRVYKIVGRADRIHQFVRKQNDVAAIKIFAREARRD